MVNSFEKVYFAPRVRVALNSVLSAAYTKKFWEVVDKLRSGRFDIKGLNVEKLHTKVGKVFSARLNIELRLIFSMYSKGDNRSLVIWDVNHHDQAYDRVERVNIPGLSTIEWNDNTKYDTIINKTDLDKEEPDSESLADGHLLFQVPHYVLSEPARYSSFDQNFDRYLRLTPEQEELISSFDQAYLVQGSAGTGKTTLALFHALNLYEANPDDNVFFFTYQEELALVCRCYKVHLVGENGSGAASDFHGDLKVFSYLDFCQNYLWKIIGNDKVTQEFSQRKTTINKAQSISYLETIIHSKSRWSRRFKAEDIYSYIYSILKGRFIPGKDEFPQNIDDYKRIFKDYGALPDYFEELMSIFDQYQIRLQSHNEFDEADLIRVCYQTLKTKSALLDDQQNTWIVIDEIQDFTELEWKSILLFWANKCRFSKGALSFPFLSGDKHQNISRSGFRWQEVNSYVETTLKDIRRSKSLSKIELSKNFRNTKEIFNLGKFIRGLSPEKSTKLGEPAQVAGNKPFLVVAEKEDFGEFLKLVNSDQKDNQLPAPIVVLTEDEDDAKALNKEFPLADNLFLMPLSSSKGMEFEDCIIYRLFASAQTAGGTLDEYHLARLFDLWYMGITRARMNLLLFLTKTDYAYLQTLLPEKLQELLEHVRLAQDTQALPALIEFYQNREQYVPNYNVIFLESTKAHECFQAWRELHSKNDPSTVIEQVELRNKALRLWLKCRDWRNLGSAYKELGEFERAIPYLELSNQQYDLGVCYDQLEKFEQAALCYQNCGAQFEAANSFELAKQFTQAATIFENLELWSRAANCYKQDHKDKDAARCFEKASDLLSAAKLYKSSNEWQKAAGLFHQAGDLENAAQMYIKLKDKLDAARCYEQINQFSKAAKLYEELNRWLEAAACHEKNNDYKQASSLYQKAGKLKEAAQCAEHMSEWQIAAGFWERMKQWDKAASCYRKAKNMPKAAVCLSNAQDWPQALSIYMELSDWRQLGVCCEKLDDLPRAIEYYTKAGCLNEAGQCHAKSEQYLQAADCFLKANNYQQAAFMLSKTKRKLDAAKLYVLAAQTIEAIDLVRNLPKDDPSASGQFGDVRNELAQWSLKNNKLLQAAQIYHDLKNYKLAAQYFKESGRTNEAASCLEEIKQFEEAAELYAQAGSLDKSADCYRKLENWQMAGKCLEKLRQWTAAIEMYEKCSDKEAVKRCQTSMQWLS
jgi:superfamily I DNA/RNA helicase/Txe/YoeB family toxin of Txe-Axe toxin-antitoxin module